MMSCNSLNCPLVYELLELLSSPSYAIKMMAVHRCKHKTDSVIKNAYYRGIWYNDFYAVNTLFCLYIFNIFIWFLKQNPLQQNFYL